MPKSLVRRSLKGYRPYVPGEQPPDGEGWVKLNTNEAPLPPSPRVLEAIKAAADESLRLYPSPTAAPARAAIARHFRLDPSHVSVGNGGDELIELCFRAFVGAGETVAYPTPTYPLLEPLCRVHEARPSTHPTEQAWDLPPSLGADPARLKFIVNPNSPTGALFEAGAMRAAVAASSGVVVVDEAYVDFAREHALGLVGRLPNVLVLRTLSKSFSLAGLRVGLAFGHPDLLAGLRAVKDSYNLSRLSQAAGEAALGDLPWMEANLARIKATRARLAAELERLGFRVPPSEANFVLARRPGVDLGPVARALAARDILVRHFAAPGLEDALRITVGTDAEVDALLAALREVARP
jgi:histidinol-phosphate aminotransferase